MWVVPLALYLVTFVIVFQTRPVLRHKWMVAVEPLFIVALVGVMVFDIRAYLLWHPGAQRRGVLRHHDGVPRRVEPQPPGRRST